MTIRIIRTTTLLVLACTGTLAAQRPVEVEDLLRTRVVSDPQLSPDGEWVAYTVRVADTARDRRDRDLWLSSWDGTRHLRLTTSPDAEHAPRWGPDGRRLAFLSARQDPREVDQVWLLAREGGEAERVTDFAGGVSDLAWSPDGQRLALIVSDPDPDAPPPGGDTTGQRPHPIVVDRWRFKEDETGYLTVGRDHLYVLDLPTRRAELITPGEYDEAAPAWSPDGRSIAFVSRRRAGPGAHRGAGPQRALAHLVARRGLGALPAGGRPGIPPRPGAGRGRRGRAAGGGPPGHHRSLGRVRRPDCRPRGHRRTAGGGVRGGGNGAAQALEPERPVARAGTAGTGGGDHRPEQGRHPDPRLHGEASRLPAGHPVPRGRPDPRRPGVAVLPRLRQPRLAGPRRPRLCGPRGEPPGQLGPGREIRGGDLGGVGPEGR